MPSSVIVGGARLCMVGFIQLTVIILHGFVNVSTGAPLQWAAIFPKEDVAFAQGATGLDFYSSHHRTDEYEIPTKVFCSYCRTPIMDEGARTCLLFPELIDLSHYGDDDSKKRRELFGVRWVVFFKPQLCYEFLF